MNIIDKIKTNGYWKVVIRPSEFIEKRIESREKCKDLITKSQVKLRGWSFPFIDSRKGIVFSGNDSISSSCDWDEGGMHEFWKFYQNGQFIQYMGMIEDYRMNDQEKKKAAESVRLFDNEKPTFLSILNALYVVTEIFYFASRLAKEDAIGEEINIEIEMGNIYKRTLFFWGEFRFLFQPYTCEFDSENILKNVVVTKSDLIDNFASLALDTTIGILKDFGWHDVNKDIFIQDQKKLLERRL